MKAKSNQVKPRQVKSSHLHVGSADIRVWCLSVGQNLPHENPKAPAVRLLSKHLVTVNDGAWVLES